MIVKGCDSLKEIESDKLKASTNLYFLGSHEAIPVHNRMALFCIPPFSFQRQNKQQCHFLGGLLGVITYWSMILPPVNEQNHSGPGQQLTDAVFSPRTCLPCKVRGVAQVVRLPTYLYTFLFYIHLNILFIIYIYVQINIRNTLHLILT